MRRALLPASLLTCAIALGGCAAPRPQPAGSGPLPRADVSEPGTTAEPEPVAPPRGATREVTASEQRAIDQLMQDAERVRELRFVRPVAAIVQDAAAIEAYVESQIEPVHVDDAIALYGALGLIDPALDLRALWLRLMSEQVVGYYDIDQSRLVIRDDVMRGFDSVSSRVKKRGFDSKRKARKQARVDLEEARVVLIHELVHALQDQHLGLAKTMQEERDTDGENALRALVEGDATLAMISYVFDKEGVPLTSLTRDPARVRSLSGAVTAPMQGTELANAPPIVRVSLMSAYVDGLSFAAALHGAGGFARVNRAYAELPQSSEQVLHPERFARHEPVPRVSVPGAASMLGERHTLVVEDTLGELEMSVYFAQGAGEVVGRRAADGWNGDRVYVYRATDKKLSAVWITTWDDERQAVEAERAALAVRAAVPADAREEHAVVRENRAVLIMRGLARPQQEVVRSRFSAWLALGKPALADGTPDTQKPATSAKGRAQAD
jgi:hypothetical protein